MKTLWPSFSSVEEEASWDASIAILDKTEEVINSGLIHQINTTIGRQKSHHSSNNFQPMGNPELHQFNRNPNLPFNPVNPLKIVALKNHNFVAETLTETRFWENLKSGVEKIQALHSTIAKLCQEEPTTNLSSAMTSQLPTNKWTTKLPLVLNQPSH